MASGKEPTQTDGVSSADTLVAPFAGELTESLVVDPEPAVVAGRYEIVGLLGSGGMGRVYRARDRELGEHVALKLLQVGTEDDPTALERFRREARLARHVTHPNVVRIFDIGDDGGRKFLTMELVDGESLAVVLEREGRLPISRALELAREVCAGLAAAHAAGVVHRDLKPANVLLARDGRVLLTDFGIATSDREATLASLTGGLLVGTPAYMAPEQVEGSTEVDARTDLFAMGAVLFEMLTGEPPWTGPTSLAVAIARLKRPARDVRELRKDVPESLALAVQRCLARNATERWASALELADALRDVEPSAEHIDPTARRAHALAPLEFGAALAGITTVAVLPLRNAGRPEDAYVGETLAEDLGDTLSTTPGLRVRAAALVKRVAAGGGDALESGRTLGVDVVIEGSVRPIPEGLRIVVRALSVADGFQLWSRRFDRALGDVLVATDEVARAIAVTLSARVEAPERKAVSDPVAVELYLRGRHAYRRRFEGEAQKKAVELLEQAVARAPDDPTILSAYAQALVRLGWFALDHQASHVRAARIAESVVASAPHIAEARLALAQIRAMWGDLPAAVREYVTILEHNPALAEAFEGLGTILAEAGLVDEGRALLERAYALDPTNESPCAWIANLCTFLGRREESAAWCARMRDEAYRPMAVLSLVRACIHDADPAAAGRLLDSLPPPNRDGEVLASAHALLARVAGRSDRSNEVAFLTRWVQPDLPPRRRSISRQLRAELAGIEGDAAAALRELEGATEAGLIDLTWMDHARPLAIVRDKPEFAVLRSRVEQAALRVREAYAGGPGSARR